MVFFLSTPFGLHLVHLIAMPYNRTHLFVYTLLYIYLFLPLSTLSFVASSFIYLPYLS